MSGRSRTLNQRHISKESQRLGALLYPDAGESRPQTRGDCETGPRPCPWVGCKWHLCLEVTEAGSIKFNHPGLEPDELVETCALDVADRRGVTLETVAGLLNVSKQRIQQLEEEAFPQLRRHLKSQPFIGEEE